MRDTQIALTALIISLCALTALITIAIAYPELIVPLSDVPAIPPLFG